MHKLTSNAYNKFLQKEVGYLFVESYVINFKEKPKFLCKCKCGNETIVLCASIAKQTTKSCGCLHKETLSKIRRKYNKEDFRAYKIYHGILTRCNNKNHGSYKNYGGRGIKCLFKSFEEFINNIGSCPSPYHEVDRINTNGYYEIGNVRWVTRSENCKNRNPKYYHTTSFE